MANAPDPLPILTVDTKAPVLRRVAAPVRKVTPAVRELLGAMVATMRAAPGVGLAAPQVGIAQRLIVVEARVADSDADEPRLWQLADPVIVWRSDEMEEDEEACLSIPGLYGEVPRHVAIGIEAIDIRGRRIRAELHDFEARVFQHEVDHLDGVLFPDRVTGLDKLYRLVRDAEGELVRETYAPDLPERVTTLAGAGPAPYN